MQDRIVAGETFNYSAEVADYPASAGWALRLMLNPRAGGTVLTVDSVASDDAHLLRAPAATTLTWLAGDYAAELWAIRGTEQYRIQRGQLIIEQSLLQAAGGLDTRTKAERDLDAVDAMISGKAGSGVQSYTIAGRSLANYPLRDLMALQAKLQRDVDRELAQAGQPPRYGTGAIRTLRVRL